MCQVFLCDCSCLIGVSHHLVSRSHSSTHSLKGSELVFKFKCANCF